MDLLRPILGDKVAGTRVVPIATKITLIFTLFLLASNFASNYINIMFNQGVQVGYVNRILMKDLSEVYGMASNQYEVYQFKSDLPATIKSMTSASAKALEGEKPAVFAVRKDGSFLFWSSKLPQPPTFPDKAALARLLAAGTPDGKIEYKIGTESWFGVFKYHEKWEAWIVRVDSRNEFDGETQDIFIRIAIVIVILTLVCLLVGVLLVGKILHFVGTITRDIMKMQQGMKMGIVDLKGAPNDEVTYLGASFNSLSSTIDNLLAIFRRFVTEDIAQRAYQERDVRLEGQTRNLAILFSDIKGFTYMTETLGNDIIDVLNLHYQRAIGRIHEHNGIVGSIIGDALLAVFGTMKSDTNKCLEAVRSAYQIQEVASELRSEMMQKRELIVTRRGALTESEERVLKAVLVEVGVGIDGGDVFYGNIGSYERMTNTVIGDNVNSSSRLEGLTRVYKVPVICSLFIKEEIEAVSTGEFRFVELDLVQVKGKTIGKRIYWPVRTSMVDEALDRELDAFAGGLKAYYDGDWRKAAELWAPVHLPLIEEFRERIEGGAAPAGWNGIWAMTTK
jgi:class 3 adenylate cyclase